MIDSKVSFMNQLSQKMADTLTVNQKDVLMKTVFDLLDSFEMIEHETENGPDDMLKTYVSALQVNCLSQKTIDRYAYEIQRMMDFANVKTRKINAYHIRGYLAAGKERGLSDQTLKGQREIFSAYFNWLQRESLIEMNPMVNIGKIKVAKKEKKTFSKKDLEKLNRCCEPGRNKAILHFLRATGCRISEVTELNRDAVNLEKLECVVRGKGNKERTVYLDEVAGMFLGEYLSERKDISPELFVNRYNERIEPNGIRAMLKKLEAKAGVDHVHPHKFRRTLATYLYQRGMPIQEIAKILGHEKLDTTMKYVMISNEEIKESYRRHAS